MVQWLGALAVLAEKNRLNPSVNPSDLTPVQGGLTPVSTW